jgi:hypothetical protein
LSRLDFVDLHLDNAKTFSNEYSKLLLLIGSEIDVVAKLLCKQIDESKTVTNICGYRQVLTQRFYGMYGVEIEVPRVQQNIKPWDAWGPEAPQSPDWWKAYNKVKHGRDKNFADANQGNVLSALCGLLVLHLYRYQLNLTYPQPSPELLDYGFSKPIGTSGGKRLPGI